MEGRTSIISAFSREGTGEMPAVITYENIFFRDHCRQIQDLISLPWWYQDSPDLSQQTEWRYRTIKMLGTDWTRVGESYSNKERNRFRIITKEGRIFQNDIDKGLETELLEPVPGGSYFLGKEPQIDLDDYEVLEALIKPYHSSITDNKKEGRYTFAHELFRKLGNDTCSLGHIASPIWNVFSFIGFSNIMILSVSNAGFLKRLCLNVLENIAMYRVKVSAELGNEVIWIEECFTDMISPEAYREINVPVLRALTDEIRKFGMKSILYFTGNPTGKLESIIDTGCDGIAFEEGRKNFGNDIHELAATIKGRCLLVGNKVKRFIEMAHDIGKKGM